MKRIISALLVICLVAMFLPTFASAAEVASVGEEYVYSIKSTGLTGVASGTDYKNADIKFENVDTAQSALWEKAALKNAANFKLYSTYMDYQITLGNLGSAYVVYRLNVPKKGYYKLQLSYRTSTASGMADIYFVKDNGEAITSVPSEAGPIKETDKKIKNFDFSGTNGSFPTADICEFEATEAGSYLVAIKPTSQGNAKLSGTQNWQQIAYGHRELKLVAISNPKAPTAVEATIEKEVLFANDTTNISSKVTLLSGEVEDDFPVTYSSADSNIAAVDSETGVVTAIAAGRTTITVTAAVGVTDTVDVTVFAADSGEYVYSIKSTGLTGVTSGTDYRNADIKFENVDTAQSMLWEKAALKNAANYKLYSTYMDYQVSNGSIGSAYVVYRLYVPKAGNYKLQFSYRTSTVSGMADIYFVKDNGEAITSVPSASGPIKETDKKIENFDFSGTNGNFPTDDICEFEATEAGNYLVAIKPTSKGNSSSSQPAFQHREFKVVPISDAEILEDAFDATSKSAIYSAPSVTALKYKKDTSGSGSVISVPSAVNGVYTIEAPAAEAGEEFLYWAIGLAGSRKILSFEETLTYKPASQGANYLIAVYEKAGAEEVDKAEFYNANGQLIPDTDGVAPEAPTMAGVGEFTGWKQYGSDTVLAEGESFEVSGTMLFVAQYEDAAKITVKSNVAADKVVSYGSEVSFTANPAAGKVFKWWTKTNAEGETEIVSIASTYSFYAWENCEVTAVYGSAATGYVGSALKILIDTFGENSVMAEFIGFENVNVIEKGIMLGDKKFAMATDKTQFVIENDEDAETISGYAIVDNGDQTFTEILDK